MALVPEKINGVTVEFASTVKNEVHEWMIEGLKKCISPTIAGGVTLDSIYISAIKDSHDDKPQSRHNQGKAVDISRINGSKMSVFYPNDPVVKAAVDAIQDAFECYENCRENFGPKFKKKLGKPWTVAGHKDHIHLSVN